MVIPRRNVNTQELDLRREARARVTALRVFGVWSFRGVAGILGRKGRPGRQWVNHG